MPPLGQKQTNGPGLKSTIVRNCPKADTARCGAEVLWKRRSELGQMPQDQEAVREDLVACCQPLEKPRRRDRAGREGYLYRRTRSLAAPRAESRNAKFSNAPMATRPFRYPCGSCASASLRNAVIAALNY
jgi:hypothetical protein